MHTIEKLRQRRPLRRRVVAREMIDDHVDDLHMLIKSFDEMTTFNRLFGGIKPVSEEILALGDARVLDVGCGIAGVAREIILAARKRHLRVSITGIDVNATIVQAASERMKDFPEIEFLVTSGDMLPFHSQQFDVAICTLTIHHCEPHQAVTFLRELHRVARRVVVADLRRCIGGLLGAYVISRFSRNLLTRNDAPLSVRRAYTPSELLQLAIKAGWSRPLVRKTPFFRMLLTNEN